MYCDREAAVESVYAQRMDAFKIACILLLCVSVWGIARANECPHSQDPIGTVRQVYDGACLRISPLLRSGT